MSSSSQPNAQDADGLEAAVDQALLILGEDVLVMSAIEHLAMPGMTEVTATPQEQRDPNCAIKYVIKPGAAMLGLIENSADTARR
jgi:hypothetical protein